MSKVDKSSLKCNRPKRTPSHKTKSHIVKACERGREKIIRFGQQGKSYSERPMVHLHFPYTYCIELHVIYGFEFLGQIPL